MYIIDLFTLFMYVSLRADRRIKKNNAEGKSTIIMAFLK